MNNKNVLYVEPNYNKSIEDKSNGKINTFELAPSLEDYCISVDFQVEIKDRNSTSINTDNNTIRVSWVSTSKDDSNRVSFFKGKNIGFGAPNFLSTSASDDGTFYDIHDGGTSECFGINSINIDFNNYMMPVITVEFTDIRGVSLFSPEELRHKSNGDIKNDVAGSFFKSFFTLPMPIFSLVVKGFYGEPVSYQLAYDDFRARFDCNTGNFGATVKFIGYKYSALSDVTLNSLVIAPNSEYIGKKYWENNLKNRFTVDGKPMITIIELVKKIHNIKKSINKVESYSEISKRVNDLDRLNNLLIKIGENFAKYFGNYINGLKSKYGNYDINSILNLDYNNFRFALYSESSESDFQIDCKNDYDDLIISIRDGLTDISIPKINEFKIEYIPVSNIYDELKKCDLLVNNISNYKYVYFFDGSYFNDFLTKEKELYSNNLKRVNDELSHKKEEIITNYLGFNPSIRNIYKILFAHFETFIHMIYYASNTINSQKRKCSSIGVKETDLKIYNDILPPFPKIITNGIENGINIKEEGWMGDLPNGKDEEEVKLVVGMLNGVHDYHSVINEVKSSINEINDKELTNDLVRVIVSPLDIMLDKPLFGEYVNFNDVSDFYGKIALRMISLYGTNNVCRDDKLMGTADAINFFTCVKNKPNRKFFDRLINGSINSMSFKLCVNNNNEIEKINGLWAWDSPQDIKSGGLSYFGVYNLYNMENDSEYKSILPVQDYNWKDIKEYVSLNMGSDINCDDYISAKQMSNRENKFLFNIDLNYEKYKEYKNLMSVDGKVFDYVDNLGLDFDNKKYIKEYFKTNGNIVKKFSSVDKSVRFDCYKENTYILSPNRPSIDEAKKMNSFKRGIGYTDDFNYVNSVLSNGEIKPIRRRSIGLNELCNDDIKNITNFTISSFGGFNQGKYTNSLSLFAQKEYYIQNDYVRALLFLSVLKESCYNKYNVESSIIDDDSYFEIMPYLSILELGGHLWLDSCETEQVIYDDRYIIKGTLNKSFYYNDIYDLRNEIKTTLINSFKDWVNSSVNGFKDIQNQFELTSINNMSTIELLDEINKIFNNEVYFEYFSDFEEYLAKNLNNEFYKNYISIKKTNIGIKLFNREYSPEVCNITNLILKPCMVFKPTKLLFKDNGRIIFKEYSDDYFNSFIKKLISLYNDDINSGDINVTKNDEKENKNLINLTYYKYIKELWDKWLSGTKEDDWKLENFFEDRWYFIDQFYNDIGDVLKSNILEIANSVIYSTKENGYTLLSFIGSIGAVDRLNFNCVHNFLDWGDNTKYEKNMRKMFTPIPYNEIDYNNINYNPYFIMIYQGEPSSKLNIIDGEYIDDTFDINGDNLPVPITSKTEKNGYRIPAFGVTYGKQYQSYFKNIDVSMDNPINTEQSIKAEYLIYSEYDGGENGNNVSVLGQDLFTIYSQNSYTCKVTMMGCAWIQPLMYFQLLNVPMFKGAYIIKKVSHTITPGNMETTFIGVRMPNVSTKKIKNQLLIKDNDMTVSSDNKIEIRHVLSDINNNCEYKYFNPFIDENSPCVDKNILDMKLTEYESYINSKFDSSVITNKNISVRNLLVGTIQAEAKGEDYLGKELVATVLFNRFSHFGKDFTKVYTKKQHEVSNDINNSDSIKIVNDIFINSPSVLIGKKTSVTKQVPIWDKGYNTNSLTIPKSITEHDVKTIDGYCTTDGYFALDKSKKGNSTQESYGWWQDKAKYSLHHKGHVFVSGAWSYDKEHWNSVNRESLKNDNDDFQIKLFNSIKKTLEYTKSIDVKSIEMKKDNHNNDGFVINAVPKKVLKNVFDIAINTYGDFISEIDWVVNNDTSEEPESIRIVATKDKPINKIISISMYRDNKIYSLLDYENLNNDFLKCLKKYYGFIDENNKNLFKMECKNFAYITSNKKDNEWVNIVNKILSNQLIKDCGQVINNNGLNNENSSFTWDGNGNLNNVSVVASKLNEYKPHDASNYAFNNSGSESSSSCAKFVREAMQKGGNADFKVWPESACAYSKYLPLWGFTEVYSGFAPITDGYSAKDGDIAVIAGIPNNSVHGHIHIYNESSKKWCSDFKANSVYCYGDNRPFKVFRWNNLT